MRFTTPSTARLAAVAACAALALLLASMAAPAVGAPNARGDFDGDGYADLAIGAPADSVQGQPGAGAVNVLYGTADGLSAAGDQQLTKRPQQVPGVPMPGARFGAALAAGDLDADGYADLAVGAPGEDAGGLRDASRSGAVTVFYGSEEGLVTRGGATGWTQNRRGVPGTARAGDSFGTALAIGHFGDDAYADLAIGVPGQRVGGSINAGAVHVLHGAAGGVSADGDQVVTQARNGIKGAPGRHHRLGNALAAGDLDGDERHDLAIGLPGGRIGGDRAGAVLVLYAGSGGISATDDLWSQDASGIEGVAEANDGFGGTLAIGDFDGDGAGDLAVGVPREGVGNANGAGAVNLIYGSGNGLRARGDAIWDQGSDGVPGRPTIGVTFGAALAAADVSGNGVDDLAIGLPGHSVGGRTMAGAITVLHGEADGLRASPSRLWHQDRPGIAGRAERSDRFGAAITTGDFDGDGVYDVAIGAGREGVGRFDDAGAVNVLYGSDTGLRAAGDQLWTQASSGVQGAPGDDGFGRTLASGAP